jgi:hypothetical protein
MDMSKAQHHLKEPQPINNKEREECETENQRKPTAIQALL